MRLLYESVHSTQYTLDLSREEPEVEIAVVLLVDSEVASITLHVGTG